MFVFENGDCYQLADVTVYYVVDQINSHANQDIECTYLSYDSTPCTNTKENDDGN
jgi:hypothetical protein